MSTCYAIPATDLDSILADHVYFDKTVKSEHMLTDGSDWLELCFDEDGDVTGFVRYGQNDPTFLEDILEQLEVHPVSEHDKGYEDLVELVE